VGETIGRVQALVAAGNSILSEHAYDRLGANGITAEEIEAGAATAIEVEDYPDFHKGPSVLVLQQDSSGQPVHVVWGIRKGSVGPTVVITVYRPDPSLWSADFRSRL
jgi:uncharacterized protein DUF4258